MLDTPDKTVLAFAKAYTDWERQMAQSSKPFDNQKLKDEHTRILATFCTIKNRAYVDGGFSFGKPPTYAELRPKKIVGVDLFSKSKAHVDTKALRFYEYRFVVIKKRDGWRIDSLKCRVPPNGEWKNRLIGM